MERRGVLPSGPGLAARLGAALLPILVVGSLAGSCAPDPGRPLSVFAAASLTDLLRDLSRLPDVPAFDVHHAGSELLVRQVQAGAPADVLVLARPLRPGEVSPDSMPRGLMATRLVLACSTERVDAPPADWAAFAALSPPPRVALADPALAPAGQVARDALRGLGAWHVGPAGSSDVDRSGAGGHTDPGGDGGRAVAAAIDPRFVLAPDVRAACTWVQLGELDYVLCYRADAAALDGLRECFAFEDGLVLYEGGVVATDGRAEPARRWLDRWRDEDVRALVRRHHFDVP